MTDRTVDIDGENALPGLATAVLPCLKTGDVVTLAGGLGAGKTSFARALIRGLAPGVKEVPSPTFTLVQVYEVPGLSVWHFDLYRLDGKELDILELGWEEARRYGVSLVEWPERLGSLLPKDRLEIKIDFVGDSVNLRRFTLTPHGSWRGRLGDMKQ